MLFVSNKALWLKTATGRIGKPSSKYKNKDLVDIGERVAVKCCSLLPAFELLTKTPGTWFVICSIPTGLTLIVNEGDEVIADQAMTKNPNVGGFGQNETEIVLQNPVRIQLMILFFFTVVIGQTFLILKKKQFEKVQAAEMNF